MYRTVGEMNTGCVYVCKERKIRHGVRYLVDERYLAKAAWYHDPDEPLFARLLSSDWLVPQSESVPFHSLHSGEPERPTNDVEASKPIVWIMSPHVGANWIHGVPVIEKNREVCHSLISLSVGASKYFCQSPGKDDARVYHKGAVHREFNDGCALNLHTNLAVIHSVRMNDIDRNIVALATVY